MGVRVCGIIVHGYENIGELIHINGIVDSDNRNI